jgi:hypothetical protein
MLDDEWWPGGEKPIEDNTIVEFNFDLVDKIWKPMRCEPTRPNDSSATRRWSTGTANDWGTRWACGVVSSIGTRRC